MKGSKHIIFNFIGFALLSLAIIISFSACPPEPEPDPKFPEAKGKLTITGLDIFNDKYVYIYGLAGGKVLIGLTDITDYTSDITYKLAKISAGKAIVPLYYANPSASSYENSFIAYNDNDTLSQTSQLNVIIISDSTLKSSNAPSALTTSPDKKNIASGSFSNGNMTFEWGGTNVDPLLEEYVFVKSDNSKVVHDIVYEYYAIKDYIGNGGDVIIPSHFNGLPILYIMKSAFKNKNLTSVVIPYTFNDWQWFDFHLSATIAPEAFTSNPNLISIKLPSHVDLYSDTFDYDFKTVYNYLSDVAGGTYTRAIGSFNWVKVN